MSNIIKFDFEGSLYSFRLDGWFNATEAAARYGKRPIEWLRQNEVKEYIEVMAEVLGCKSKVSQNHFGLVQVKRGGVSPGTWMHPKLAVRFAQWLNIRFSVWCDLQIDDIVRSGIQAKTNTDLIPLLLRTDVAEWELRFSPEYYHALAKATKTKYIGHSGGTPAIYGQITDKWVYSCILPKEVYLELKARKHESEKMHQWLTDGGQELLDKQISQVTAIALSSADYKDFEARMMTLSKKKGQLGFVYPGAAA